MVARRIGFRTVEVADGLVVREDWFGRDQLLDAIEYQESQNLKLGDYAVKKDFIAAADAEQNIVEAVPVDIPGPAEIAANQIYRVNSIQDEAIAAIQPIKGKTSPKTAVASEKHVG